MSRNSLLLLLLLLLILAAGTALRFYGLDRESFWTDEFHSWKRSHYNDLATFWEKSAGTDRHPPGYYILLLYVQKLLGDSEFSLRLPSALAGVASIGIIFLIGRRLYGTWEGLLASSFLAVLWCPIFYSQEVRSYSLLLLFSLLTTYFWLEALFSLLNQNPIKARTLAVYVPCAIICSYLHYFGLYMVALQGLAILGVAFWKKRERWRILAVYLLAAAAYLPWLHKLNRHLHSGRAWIPDPDSETVVNYAEFLFNQSALIAGLAAVWIILFLVATLKPRPGNAPPATPFPSHRFSTLLLLGWVVIPFAGALVKSLVSAPILSNRNMIISAPAIYLLLARAVTRLPAPIFVRRCLSLLLPLAFAAHLVWAMDYYHPPHKTQYREAARYIADRADSYSSAVIMATAIPSTLDYYFEKLGSPCRVDQLVGPHKPINNPLRFLSERKPRHIWYIRAHRPVAAPFLTYLQSDFQPIKHQEFLDAEVWLFRKKE